jgi:putative membrane protein
MASAPAVDLRLRWALAGLVLAAVAWTLGRTGDRLTWTLEAFPVLVGLPLLVATRRRFPLTPLLYAILFVHALVLLHGAQHTYAEAPLGYALKAWLGTVRNPWDKVGHFLQGVTPALLAREVLLRGRHLRRSWTLGVLCVCVALAFSAFYELIEWWVALAGGQSADAFLGTQGDPWDTQSDMAFALAGAIAATTLLARRQDRQIEALEDR